MPAEEVWGYLVRFYDSRIYRGMQLDMSPDSSSSYSGTAVIGGAVFRVSAVPRDIKMTSRNVRLGIRVKEAENGCVVIAASSCLPDANLNADREALRGFVARVAAAIKEDMRGRPSPSASAAPRRRPAVTGSTDKTTPSVSEEKIKADPGRRSGSTGRKGKGTSGVALLLLLLVLTAAGAWPALSRAVSGAGSGGMDLAAEDIKGSSSVTLESALAVAPGDSRSDAESRLGKGQSDGSDSALYFSSDLTPYGTPSVAVKIDYDGSSVSAVTVLDLARASSTGGVTGSSLSGSSKEEFDSAAGTSPSMVRSWSSGGTVYREYHYGYLDPRHNFSPSWEGQLWARTGSDGTTATGTGYRYDGTDPLFHSDAASVTDTRYTDFDPYLRDFYSTWRALDLRSQPDRAAASGIFRGLTAAGNVDETSLYNAVSDDVLPDGDPVWSYTIGFGTRGDFVLFSAVNRRLWDRAGALDGTSWASVRSGMNYREAAACLGILPSMVYIDYSYITLGYGEFDASTDVLTEQFEFCMRLRISDLSVESVYDNTGTQLVID